MTFTYQWKPLITAKHSSNRLSTSISFTAEITSIINEKSPLREIPFKRRSSSARPSSLLIPRTWVLGDTDALRHSKVIFFAFENQTQSFSYCPLFSLIKCAYPACLCICARARTFTLTTLRIQSTINDAITHCTKSTMRMNETSFRAYLGSYRCESANIEPISQHPAQPTVPKHTHTRHAIELTNSTNDFSNCGVKSTEKAKTTNARKQNKVIFHFVQMCNMSMPPEWSSQSSQKSSSSVASSVINFVVMLC